MRLPSHLLLFNKIKSRIMERGRNMMNLIIVVYSEIILFVSSVCTAPKTPIK